MKTKNQRNKLLVSPGRQIRLISRLAWIMYGFILLCTVIVFLHMYDKHPVFIDEASEALYKSQIRTTLIFVGITLLLAGISIYISGLYITHKIFGPLIPIEKTLEELSRGNYNVEDIQLRRGDELQSLATKINSLKNTLRKYS